MKKIPLTYEECDKYEKLIINKLKKFKNRKELFDLNQGIYARLYRDQLHILDKYLPARKEISFDDVLKDAQKYSAKHEWIAASKNLYVKASVKGWLPECTKHMTSKIKKWTFDSILEEALKYKSKGEWKENSPSSYDAAQRLGMEKFNKHMTSKLRSFTKEEYMNSAKPYKTQAEWKRNACNGIIKYGSNRGWLEEACAHMIKTNTKRKVRSSDGVIYGGISEAGRIMGTFHSNIIFAVKNGTKCCGLNWEYVEDKNEKYTTNI